jgi:hypothetical protein
MLTWVQRALQTLSGLKDSLQALEDIDFQSAESWVDLLYAPLPDEEQAKKRLSDLLRIADGDVTSPDVQEAVAAFKNTMNIPPDSILDPRQSRFVAMALAEAAQRTLAAIQVRGAQSSRKLHLAAWRLGNLRLLFLGCEALAVTGMRLQGLRPNLRIFPVTYLAPLLGYLPDREALRLGGYEVSEAWRFYGHPAPFAEDSEARALAAADNLLAYLD